MSAGGVSAAALTILVAVGSANMVGEAVVEKKDREIVCAENYQEVYKLFVKNQLARDADSREYAMYETTEANGEAADIVSATAKAIASGGDYSTTNTRDAMVDEGDIVKTDGERIYCLNRKKGIAITEADEGKFSDTVWLKWEDIDENPVEFYVVEDKLILISEKENSSMKEARGREMETFYIDTTNKTIVRTYDTTQKELVLLTEYEQDGNYKTSRENDGYLYLFTEYIPNEETITEDEESFVPKSGGEILEYNSLYYPFGRNHKYYYDTRYLVMASLELENAEKSVDQKALISDSEMFYVSDDHIYTMYSSWEDSTTMITSFGYQNGQIEPGAVGKVPGNLNDTFSLDEYKDNLRIVTSQWKEEGRENGLYILNEDMNITGKIEGIAKGEDIRSARFMGDTAYFVTYENTDPLFSADVSDPENPKLIGELKITGFSSYLHPYGENRLLGIGWETDPETGFREGLKLSMFDTTDLSDVKECGRMVIENVNDVEGLTDYRAILANAEKNIIGFSILNEDGSSCYCVFSYQEDGFRKELIENVTAEPDSWVQEKLRGIYIGDYFYVVDSEKGRSYDMEDDFAKLNKTFW